MNGHRASIRSLITRASIASFGGVLLISAMSTLALAADDEAPPPSPVAPEEAARRDAEAYATSVGVSVDEALIRLKLLPSLTTALDRSSKEAGSRFAGGWIDHDAPELRIVARFTGQDSGLDRAVRAISGVDAHADIEFGAPHSLEDLRQGQAAIRDEIYRQYPGTGMYVDVKSGAVTLVGSDEISATSLAELADLAGVPVVRGAQGELRRHHTYGGHRIGGCTTAFSSYDAVHGTTGVLTAGHCAGAPESLLTYYQTSPAPTYPATLKGKRYDANQDFAWYTTTHDEYPYFYDGSAYRSVFGTKARLDMPGNLACKYGRVTGYSCGIVDTVHFDPGFNYCNNGPCDDVWGAIISDYGIQCMDGDSGGPMFYSNTAWGIHSGGLSTGPGYGECAVSIYMTAGALLWDGVNTRIMLDPTGIATRAKYARDWHGRTGWVTHGAKQSIAFLTRR